MDDIVKDFLIESGENLDRLDQELVQLESDPKSKELIASIFRTIHTIKGSCGFLGFARLEKVAHAGENLLSRLREGNLSLTAEVTSGLLATVDAVRHMLSEIQSTGADGEKDYPELLEMLKKLQEPGAKAIPAAAPAAPTPVEQAQVVPAPQAVAPAPETPPKAPVSQTHTPSDTHRPAAGKLGGILVERGRISAEDLAVALAEQEHGDQRRVGEILVALGLCKQEDILAAQQILEMRGREAGIETVRVGVTLLDKLMNLVGELVLARNQLLQYSNNNQDTVFHGISQRMDLIATELQEEVMKTRMQPIANVWNKFPRTVRDLALGCGKEVRLEMEGQETELDRTILEAVKDPLTHLVRNAIDHGIEAPDVRTRKGKPASGTLTLRAFHESGQVNIEIADDGAGLNVERIRSKALERGLITSEQASRMPERDLMNLIFLPGFSTAEKVTNVSGRGVGMDVVRTNLERIGGNVDLQSVAGSGTKVRIKIPLTLAIVPALVVRCVGERFCVPQMSLTELVRLEDAASVENVHGAPVYRLRGDLLPLIYLEEVLQPAAARSRKESATHGLNIVVLQAGSCQFGLVVDDILDTEEIVVKPLSRQLKGINLYAGATIMGDGRVALILDVVGLAERSHLLTDSREAAQNAAAATTAGGDNQDRQALLLAENGAEGRVAIPMESVARLEEFPASVIEYTGEQAVMQYRGKIIPLVRLSQVVPPTHPHEPGPAIQVVVYSKNGRTVGLIVDHIVDIVEQQIALESVNPRPGTSGTCVVIQRVTDLLDVAAIVDSALGAAPLAVAAEETRA